MIAPRHLSPGDTVAIVSPASVIDSTLIDGAANALKGAGYDVAVMPHARDSVGTYAGTHSDRIDDISRALTDPHVRAILCSRGGYGCIHLLEHLDRLNLEADPKWLIGFSDVSALHALFNSRGVMSIHGSMAKGLARNPIHSTANQRLLSLLDGTVGHVYTLDWKADPRNRLGTAVGQLRGGNLAVIQALIATPFDPFAPGSILLVEDIAEPIYKVERMMMQLRLSGRLDTLAGIIIGQFTDYRPDANHADMYQMLDRVLAGVGCPVAFNAPIGHVDFNQPVVMGANATLTVDNAGVTLNMNL